MTNKQELSAKKQLLQGLMRCPHRELGQTIPVFSNALEKDPLFAGKCLYALTLPDFNKIRDLAESGIAFLLTSPYPEHRTAGRILFQPLEPYRAYRVARFVRNDLKKTNRQVKGAVLQYLRTIEGNTARFDRAVMVARKPLHQMFEFYHIKPSARTQAILFEGRVPEGEIDIIKLLKEAPSPEEQAKLIVEHKVPYRLATSVLKAMTPAIWVALIEIMTPVEAVNARASVERSGILEDSRIRKLYERKLEKSKRADKVSVAHLAERKSARGTDEGLEKIVQEARQEKVDKAARITLNTLIAVDCSGSLEEAIAIAKRLCPMVASICDGEMRVYCFNDVAWPLEFKGTTLKEFESAFRMIKADGATCLGAALKRATDEGFVPEQAVYVTDQGENRRPELAEVYQQLLTANMDPRFIFVTLPGYDMSDKVVRALERVGADVVDYRVDTKVGRASWYSEMDNVLPLLAKGGYMEIVEKIMALELPS